MGTKLCVDSTWRVVVTSFYKIFFYVGKNWLDMKMTACTLTKDFFSQKTMDYLEEILPN